MAQEKHWIWLSECLRGSNGKVDDILSRFEDAEEFYLSGVKGYSSVPSLTETDIKRLDTVSLDWCDQLCRRTRRLGVHVIPYGSESYPKRLINIYNPPMVLYAAGDLSGLDEAVVVAVVGTRNASEYGISCAYSVSFDLARAGAVVVSGLAYGIDTAAMEGALAGGGRVIGFLSCGINVNYPAKNAPLKTKIVSSGGAIVTEYSLGMTALPEHFQVRNRLISGVSLGVFAVEAPKKSGVQLTVNCAVDQGKDVFTIPNNIYEKAAEGTNELLKEGVTAVTCAQDILKEYENLYPEQIQLDRIQKNKGFFGKLRGLVGGSADKKRVQDTKKRPVSKLKKEIEKQPEPTGIIEPDIKTLTEEEARVYRALSEEPIHLEELAASLMLKSHQVLAILTTLEIAGYIKVYNGKRYSK